MRELAVVAWLSCTSLCAQASSCRVDGRVRDPMLRPVVGATLFAERDGVVLARTGSDAEGRYRFGALPQERLRIVATASEPAVGACWVDLFGASERWLDLSTMPARAVHGTVTDAAGAPVANAFVVAFACARGQLGPCATSTTTDAEGRYRLGHVPFGDCAIRVYAEAWAPHDATIDGIENH